MAVTSKQVQELYVAYLGRAADKAGLDYWLGELNNPQSGLTLENLRANFVNEQPEYARLYGGLSVTQTVARIYENLFERPAEPAGRDYWVGEVNAGRVLIDQLLVAFLNGASVADRQVVDNKVAVAEAYTAANPDSFNATEATAAIDNVDGSQASVDAAMQRINPASSPAPRSDFMLTSADESFANGGTNNQESWAENGTAQPLVLMGIQDLLELY